jgi:UDP-glucose 4-epimerase
MRSLVTGGAGFVGHHLVNALLADAGDVVVIDDLSTGQRARLSSLEERITFIEGSILDDAALDRAMAGRDIVFHHAALASVAWSLADPIRSDEVNVRGTIRVMLAAARHRVRRVIFAGSSAVYGTPQSLPCVETTRPVPESPYGVSKLAAEHYVHVLGRQLGIETVVLRYFNVFGPGQDPASEYAAVVPRFTSAVLAGERPTINGSAGISRDFIYIDNVVHANLLAAGAQAGGLTCNIASGERTTLSELLAVICAAAGRTVEPRFGPPREGDIQHSFADIALARSALGYKPVVSLEAGIGRTVDWFARSTAGSAAA